MISHGAEVAAIIKNATIISPHDENPLVEGRVSNYDSIITNL